MQRCSSYAHAWKAFKKKAQTLSKGALRSQGVREGRGDGKEVKKIVVDNKLKGAYAESDLDTGVIRVNKKRHYEKGFQRINPTKDGHENLTSTIYHERLHFKHPRASERSIRKMEKSGMKTLSNRSKRKLLASIE